MLSEFVRLITGVACSESVICKTQCLHFKCFLEDSAWNTCPLRHSFHCPHRYTNNYQLAPSRQMLRKFIQLITGGDCTESVTYKTQSLHLKCFLEDNIKHLPASTRCSRSSPDTQLSDWPHAPPAQGLIGKGPVGTWWSLSTVVAYQKATVPATP